MKTVINAALVALLSAVGASAESTPAPTPEQQCRRALEKSKPRNLHPTKAEHEARLEATRLAFAVCRGASIPVDLRVESTRRWSIDFGSRDRAATEKVLRDTIREIRAAHGADSPTVIPLLGRLMDVVHARDFIDQKKSHPSPEVLSLAEEILRIAEVNYGRESEQAALALSYVGYYHELIGSRAQAESFYREAIAAARAGCGPRCATLAGLYSTLRNLIKTDPARQAEAEELWRLGSEASPD